ncbi:MAG: aminotransferase class V-fold PLP-dependent enzyme, partial [Bacteroidota bacterium]|nr:aminotransferase class V-fold PLP-dependent enzyme [Bacteroidota bacterium]
MLKSVRAAGLHALEMRASPWNLSSADWFTNAETLRGLAASIFKTSNNNIAFIPSASYGLAVAGKNLNLKPGKEIIVLEHQYPSNYYIWQHLAETQKLQIVIVEKSNEKTLTEKILEKIN